jgi:hypothetical protein
MDLAKIEYKLKDKSMNVNELRDRIVELSHQGASDGEIQTRAMGWLNAAYHEVMDELLPFAPAALQIEETTATDAAGVATLAQTPYRIMGVMDMTAGRMLFNLTPMEVLSSNLGTGSGQRGYVPTAAGLRLVPAASATLKVLYVPAVADLVANAPESTVLLPKAHHTALVWGGLVWSSLFERGFGTQGELAMFQTQWQKAKESVKLALLGNAGLRVSSYGN